MSRLELAVAHLVLNTSSPLVLAQWLLLLVVPLLLVLHYYASRRSDLPPSPPGLPIIGHLHLFGDLPHVSLRDLAAKHARGGGGAGGLMLLRLGAVHTLVVSSPRAAEAIMRTHDHVFASRPTSTAVDDLLYGSSDIAFSPYGAHWRQIRKLVTTHLFTVKKVHSYGYARKQEVSLVIDKIREAATAGVAVDMSVAMFTFANDIVSRAVSGKFFRAEGRNKLFRELVEANFAVFGGFNLEDYFPGLARTLGFMSPRRFMRNKAKETHERWDELLETILNDHEIRPRDDSAMQQHHDDDGGDFTDVLLSVQKGYGLTRDHVKAILVDMFDAGTDTSYLVLEFAMAELMRNPQQMARLQGEVRKHTREGRQESTVEEEDLASMPYLKAVVKETLRLHPPAPLLVPHLSMADCIVHGYHVPSGTRVIVNAWALGRDPESWEKPEEFMPERFMDDGSAAGVDFKGNHFHFLPFGAGRRICPGLNFGMATVEIMLANLMYCFDWQLPMGMEEKDVDMTEVFGLTVHRKDKLMLVPKLPAGAASPAAATGTRH